MTGALAAEWLKLRSLPSALGLLAAAGAAAGLAVVVTASMADAWAALPPEARARFLGRDAHEMALPLLQALLGSLGALLAASEYTSGTIRPTLLAVPRRLVVLTAKAAVAGGLSAVAGPLLLLAAHLGGRSYLAGLGITGTSGTLPASELLAAAASVLAVALLGVGLGIALRSTAGAVAAVCGLVLAAPTVAPLLPARAAAVAMALLPPGLPAQLAGTATPGPPVPVAAAPLALAAYALLPLVVAAVLLTLRDA